MNAHFIAAFIILELLLVFTGYALGLWHGAVISLRLLDKHFPPLKQKPPGGVS